MKEDTQLKKLMDLYAITSDDAARYLGVKKGTIRVKRCTDGRTTKDYREKEEYLLLSNHLIKLKNMCKMAEEQLQQNKLSGDSDAN